LIVLDVAWLIPAFPLLGFILLVLFGRRIGEPGAGWLATLASTGAFVSTVVVFAGMLALDAAERFHIVDLFTWLDVGSFTVDAGLLVDPLSITMCLFITGVGTLIHLYSVGYMHGDPNFSKFFIYLNLFITSMLLLVLGDNLLLTFLGWEGVGACSYLLISFWFDEGDEGTANASAGKKAFVTNRVGDLGFMLATFLVFVGLGSINYDDIATGAGELSGGDATMIVILFLLAAAGKSAQLPLFVWLPDAMAGPTPVSALIHAATMVTSGVFLLTRLNPILAEADVWSTGLIAWVGALTALFAATVAVAQNDIKRVLAYSTVSQLGYLFLAVGVGGYVPAIFHMVTHAFFKALLFLGSGSVIHGLHDEQDMRRMGGLRKFMPITAMTFIVGWLAIAGVPPFSGFWSKDEILLYAWNYDGLGGAAGGKVLWAIGLVTAILTAFYMTRQVILTFFGRTRFFDLTANEVAHAWDGRLEAAEVAVAESRDAEEAALAAVEKAREDVTKKHDAVTKAEEKLAAAREAFDTAGGESEDLDEKEQAKLVKAVDRATTAVPKAEEAVIKAEEKVIEMLAAVEGASSATNDRQSELVSLRTARNLSATPETVVTANTEAVKLDDGVAEHLPESFTHRQEYHPHESPLTMTIPLMVLAALAATGGLLNLPFASNLHFLQNWLEPSLFGNEVHVTAGASTKWALAIIAVVCGLAAIMAAIGVYLRGRRDPNRIEMAGMRRAWYVDESYANFFGGPGRLLFDGLARFDRVVIDGAVRGIARGSSNIGDSLRAIQPGFVRSYGLAIGLGSVLTMLWFLGRMF